MFTAFVNVILVIVRVNGSHVIDEHLPIDDILDPDGARLRPEYEQGVGIPAPGQRDVELAVREDVA
jgi:hypothetical protein